MAKIILASREMDVAIKAVKRAGLAARKIYKKKYSVGIKSNHEPVSDADIISNNLLQQALKPLGYPILSEESTDDPIRLKSRRVWIIDPLDGTNEFINKTGEFTIMIGLVEAGRPVLGVIYNPTEKVLYYGVKGEGSFVKKEGVVKKLKVSAKTSLKQLKAYTSRFHFSETEKQAIGRMGIKNLVTCGSSKKLCLIADGRGEININLSDKTWEWDICAADIILREAGGRLTDRYGQEFLYNKRLPRNLDGYVASNGLLHQQTIKETKRMI